MSWTETNKGTYILIGKVRIDLYHAMNWIIHKNVPNPDSTRLGVISRD